MRSLLPHSYFPQILGFFLGGVVGGWEGCPPGSVCCCRIRGATSSVCLCSGLQRFTEVSVIPPIAGTRQRHSLGCTSKRSSLL